MNSVFWRRVSLILTPIIFIGMLVALGPLLGAAFERGSLFNQIALSLVAAHLCLTGAWSFYHLWTGRRWNDVGMKERRLLLLYVVISLGAAFWADNWSPRAAKAAVKAVSVDSAARDG